MKIGEAIERVQSEYSKGMASDDSRLSNRFIYSNLRSIRILLLSQAATKKQAISQWCYQPVVVNMQLAPKHECAEITSATCKVLKSSKPIPQIFTDISRHLIQSVTTLDGSVNFGETKWESIKYNNKGRKYANNLPEFFLKNGYLYITVIKVMDKVLLSALFNDPIEARNYSNSCGGVTETCESYLDYEFSIDGKMEDAVIKMTTDSIINYFVQIKDDRLNNGVDDVTAAGRIRNQNTQSNE